MCATLGLEQQGSLPDSSVGGWYVPYIPPGRYGDGVIAGSGIEERFMDLVLVFGDR